MKFVIAVLLPLLFLSGCSTANSKLATVNLPDVIEYAPEVQKIVAAEVIGGKCPASTEFLIDYGVMRDQTRAAAKRLKK